MNDRESRNLEYKEDISNTFLKTVSAFANFDGGRIVFGVDDDGRTVGLAGDLEQACLSIENKVNDALRPVPPYRLEIDEKRGTVTLAVQEGIDKPYLYKNKAYRRNDSATVEVERMAFNRLVLDGANLSYEELPASDQDLTFHRLEAQLVEKLHIGGLTMDILKTLSLYSDKDGYNRAAALLADHNDFPGVDLVRFGVTIDDFRDREILDHFSVIGQFDGALTMYRKYYQYEQVDGAQRKTVALIPEQAFREAVANSLVHRTWDVKTAIKIAMYEDRIEIVSPGGLPFGISPEEYLHGQISILRNPILGNVFFRLGFIEKFGTGIRRINAAYEQSIIKPRFDVYPNSIAVTLPVLSLVPTFLTEDEKRVFQLLKVHVRLSRTEIEEKTHFSKDKVIRILNQLIDENIIQRVGHGRGTRYICR